MPALSAVQSSCAVAFPDPPRPSHPAGTRGVGGCCSHSSLSLSLAGRVVWTGGGEGARGAPHRGAASAGAGAAPFASRRAASTPDGAHDLATRAGANPAVPKRQGFGPVPHGRDCHWLVPRGVV